MIDSFDYKEPACSLCEGKEFYSPSSDSPDGRIPIGRIIEKVDTLFNQNDYTKAGRLLEYWNSEAIKLKDKNGELSIKSELIGYYRKIGKKEKTFETIDKALILLDQLKLADTVSGATIFLNIATGYKAFNENEKAFSFYQKTLEVYNKKLEKTDRLFAGLYNNTALALSDLDRPEEAENYFLKALVVLEKNNDNESCADRAITYINMAHLYEKIEDKNKLTDCLLKSYNLLTSEDIKKDGYHAFVLSKCAPSFAYFGYSKIANELKLQSEIIYERNRNC